tara:strand:- start:376 stop:582 length:207 start_codon:yes stop_codon:yes gene_type:complete
MIELALATLLATHNPYHWNMTCVAWKERATQIMMDENLPHRTKLQLIGYLRSKVNEPCPKTTVITKAT